MMEHNRDLWQHDFEPRPVQLEALTRSIEGVAKFRVFGEPLEEPIALPHYGRVAEGWGHFMEMRLGKTPTALSEFKWLVKNRGVNRLLVISPSQYAATWLTELTKFGVKAHSHLLDSTRRRQALNYVHDARFVHEAPCVLVVAYESLVSDANVKVVQDFVDARTMVVADESVMVKNHAGQRFKTVYVLSQPAPYVRALTGLPTPQSVADMWAQLRLCRALKGVNFFQFRNRYVSMGGFKNKKMVGTRNMGELRGIVRRHAFTAKRVDWGKEVGTQYESVHVALPPKLQKAYDEMDGEFVTWVNDSEVVSVEQAISKQMKMQQIAAGFIYDEDGNVRELMPFSHTPKFIHLLNRLQIESSGKIIVVAHYTPTVARLMEGFKEFNPAVVSGKSTMGKLGRTVENEKRRFNEDPACRLLIGQSTALKYGHTLMGTAEDPCLDIAFFENNYSLDTRSQCEQRPQGVGQVDMLNVCDYYTCALELDIVRALQRKQAVADVIMPRLSNKTGAHHA